jgi:hypothetical protein
VSSWRPDLSASHFGFAALRIVYHSGILWLLWDLWSWRASAFAAHRPEASVLLPLGLLVNASLTVGFLTRPLLIVNAVLLRVVFLLCQDPYTVDDVVQYFSFVLAFAPEPRALSVDSARRGEHDSAAALPTGFVLFVFVALVLLYEDSVCYKLGARIWQAGSAFWLGAALPHWAWIELPHWLEHEWLMKAMAWSVLGYEGLFPLLVVPGLRRPLLAMGLALHAGTAVFFPLQQFGVVMIGVLVFFLRPPPRGSVAPPWWAGSFGYTIIGLTLLSQVWLHHQPWDRRNALSWITGTTRWAIFDDSHFMLRAPLYRFVAETPQGERPIPSFDEHGRPTTRDRYWKVVGFSLRGGLDAQAFFARYLPAWFEKEGIRLAPVRVECKDVKLRTLELDFTLDDEIRARPWRPCYTVRFESTSPPASR